MKVMVSSLVEKKVQEKSDKVERKSLDWSNINNLHELLQSTDIYRLEYRIDTSYVICNPCSAICKSVDGQQYVKRIKRSDTFPYGIKIKREVEAQYWSGEGRDWTVFKHKMKKHYEGTDRSSTDMHYSGLRFLSDRREEESRSYQIHRRFVRLGLQTVKNKSSGESYEIRLAEYHNEGIDIGNIQHSRKQFPDICDALMRAADSSINNHLSSILPATGAPPHCCLTFDKSTIHRETNQAIMVISTNRGKRQAYFIDAPLVYSKEEGDQHLSGGQAQSLASQISSALRDILPDVKHSACVGAVADGQYQGNKFFAALKSEFFPCASSFNFIQWDSAHALDLIMKKLSNDIFMRRISNRASKFHQKLGYGKMHSITQSLSENHVHYTKPLSTTRFIASTIDSFQKIASSFPQYIAALYEYGGLKRSTSEDFDEDEYMMVGQDFVLDLLFMLDASAPVLKLMASIQNLQIPAWKIVPGTEATIKTLEEMLDSLRDQPPNGLWKLPPSLFPSLSKFASDVISKKEFKGVRLVEGWLIDYNAKTQSGFQWVERQSEDVMKDALQFLEDLLEEINSRMDVLTSPPLKNLYSAMDLSLIMKNITGKYNSILKQPIVSPTTPPPEFRNFVKYVKSLPHVEVGFSNSIK